MPRVSANAADPGSYIGGVGGASAAVSTEGWPAKKHASKAIVAFDACFFLCATSFYFLLKIFLDPGTSFPSIVKITQ
jgi:hypothetical protein